MMRSDETTWSGSTPSNDFGAALRWRRTTPHPTNESPETGVVANTEIVHAELSSVNEELGERRKYIGDEDVTCPKTA